MRTKITWTLFCTLLTLIFLFPVSNVATDAAATHSSTTELNKAEKKINQLNKKLEKLEKQKKETFNYVKKRQQKLAKQVGTDVEIIRTLQQEAKNYNIPFEIAYQVIRLESNFNPEHTNYNEWNDTHDRGLFQLNDNTSPWLAEKVGIDNFNYDKVYKPELNIKMGLWYLDYLHGRYGNWHETLTAYNRGMGGLEKYKRHNGTSRSTYSKRIINRSNEKSAR